METEKIIDANKQGHPLLTENIKGNTKKLYIESYGCQMNLNDSEIVASILSENNFNTTQLLEEADLVLVNTCSIRDKAEQTIRKRLQKYNAVKKINPAKSSWWSCSWARFDRLSNVLTIDIHLNGG